MLVWLLFFPHFFLTHTLFLADVQQWEASCYLVLDVTTGKPWWLAVKPTALVLLIIQNHKTAQWVTAAPPGVCTVYPHPSGLILSLFSWDTVSLCFHLIIFHHPRFTSLFAVTAVGSSCSMTAWNRTSLWRKFLLVSALYWTSHRAAWSSSTLRMASVWARSSTPSASPATPYLPWRDLVTWSLKWPWRSQRLPNTGSSDKDGFLENPSLSSWPLGSAIW